MAQDEVAAGAVPPTLADAGELVTALVRLTRALRRVEEPDAPSGVMRVLSILDELGPSTVTTLAAADGTAQPTMTAAVKTLVERGWGIKEPHPDDARSTVVSMTDAGRDRLARAREFHARALAERLEPYTQADVVRVTTFLRHLLLHEPTRGPARERYGSDEAAPTREDR